MSFLPVHNPGDMDVQKMYPPGLQLELVQIFFRHGERTPVAPRFPHLGVPTKWLLCSFKGPMVPFGNQWEGYKPTGKVGDSLLPLNLAGEHSLGHKTDPEGWNKCGFGELTDAGRFSALALGSRLRHLYIDTLHFVPAFLGKHDVSVLELRSTRFQRTFASLQHVVAGLYPPPAREPGVSSLMHVAVRDPTEETLLPNEVFCPRLIQLFAEFSKKTAQRWEGSSEVQYLQSKLGLHLPEGHKPGVRKSEGRVPLHEIWDTVNAMRGSAVPHKVLPEAFFDEKGLEILEKIVTEEEHGGLAESREMQELGIGQPLSEVVNRMIEKVEGNMSERRVKLAMFSCHDSTSAAMMTALGAMRSPNWIWPRYSSYLAIEMFRGLGAAKTGTDEFGKYFVRLSFMGRPLAIPVCQSKGGHFPGDQTLCTFAAFKKAVEDIAPRDWKSQCLENLNTPVFG